MGKPNRAPQKKIKDLEPGTLLATNKTMLLIITGCAGCRLFIGAAHLWSREFMMLYTDKCSNNYLVSSADDLGWDFVLTVER